MATIWPRLVLVLFWASLLFHLAIVAGLVTLQPSMVFFWMPAPVANSRRPRLVLWSRWSTWRVALRYMPLGWRIFGLPLYLIYAPLAFLGGGRFWAHEIGISVIPAMAFLADYVCLAFVIPNRRAILAAVGHEQ